MFVCNTFHNTPGIDTTPKLATVILHLNITPNYCKRDAVLQREVETITRSVFGQMRRHIAATRNEMSQVKNLQYLVLFLKVFVFI